MTVTKAYSQSQLINQPAPTSVSLQEQQFTASGTWTAPAGVTKVWVRMIGGGGGGARTESYYFAGTGVTGGIVDQMVSVSPGTTYSAVIGAGGATQTGPAEGNLGNDTTFLGLTAYGGQGGPWWGSGVGSTRVNFGSGVNGRATNSPSQPGPANTGIGGTGDYYGNGGAGGSGLIILRWTA
jgi:hypothetical protein